MLIANEENNSTGEVPMEKNVAQRSSQRAGEPRGVPVLGIVAPEKEELAVESSL